MMNRCLDCKKETSKEAKRCRKCSHKHPDYINKCSIAKIGKLNPNYGKRGAELGSWRGGRIIRNKYIMIKCDNHPFSNYSGYVYEHRLVMEKYLERYLIYISKGHPDNEVVHHINEIVDDNRLENLQLMKHKDHMKMHQTGKKPWNAGIHLPEVMKNKISETMKKIVKNYKRGNNGRFQ